MHTVDPTTAAAHRRYPSISLLLPLDGTPSWRPRLERLRRQAEARIRAEFGDDTDRHLIDRLRDAVTHALPPAGARGLAVFVNRHTAATLGVDCDVRERTVIDDTFATRDLLADDLRKPRYWVLALNLDDPRLFHGHGGRLDPVPLRLRDTVEHPSSRRERHGRDRSATTEARRIRRLRSLDQALGEALVGGDDPVLVVGAEPTISRFLDKTRHVARVEGVVRRGPDRDLAGLAATVDPALDEILGERRLIALQALDRAVGAGTAASGLEPVWRAAHRGPGVLLVEGTYEQAVHVLPRGRVSPADDATAPGVIDDGVDEIIEAVLSRGGRVELVPDGILPDHQRIAFVPDSQRGR